jgi:hypothetical protein
MGKIIYMDWNLYAILKNPFLEAHLILKKFLNDNKNSISLVYSTAHLDDLCQMSDKLTADQNKDLKYLGIQTNNRAIVNYWGSSEVIIDKRDPIEFFETNELNNSTSFLKIIDVQRRMITDKYGLIRDKILREHFKIDPKHICNLSKDQLDILIKEMGISNSLDDFLKWGLELRTSSVDILSYVDYYYTAYTSLDLINYFPDSMEEGEFENLKNDAMHSAYGSLCDAFITNDNKCYHKSKFLFDYFKSTSKLIRTCKIKNIEVLQNELTSI